MKRKEDGDQGYTVLSDSSSDSDAKEGDGLDSSMDKKPVGGLARFVMSEDVVIKRAEMYQEYMKHISVPLRRGSVIQFTTWQGLAKSVKSLYGQPLHYLTNVHLKQWDLSRIGAADESQPLDAVIHPAKAEATIWLMEEIHRLTTSHHHLAKLWISDPMHHAFVDPIYPQL